MKEINDMSPTERRTAGLKLSAKTGGDISSSLDTDLLLKSDKTVAFAKSKVTKIDDKIETTEKAIHAMQELKEIINNISNAVKPLSTYSSGQGLEHEDINLFDDYAISTTSQDTKEADHYIEVSRIKYDGSYSRFSGSEIQHSVHITQLAESDTYEFDKKFSSANDALGFAGTLKLNNFSITVTANQSLNTIITNVNDAKTGVTLEQGIDGLGNYKVTMRSSESGLENALDLTDTSLFFDETVDSNGDRLFDGLTKRLDSITTKTTEAQDAIIKTNGGSATSFSSNKIKHAIPGMEFNLKNANSSVDNKITIKLSANIDKVSEAIINYAASTNALNEFIALHTTRTSSGEFSEGACLQEERTFAQGIYTQIRTLIDSQAVGISNGLTSLSQLGFVYEKIEEKKIQKKEDSILIPRHNEFQLQKDDSVKKIVKEKFDEVRKVFQLSFDTNDSALNLLSYQNKMIDKGILKFSLVINKDNLSGNAPVTGEQLDISKKAAIIYTKLNGEVGTIYPPKVEMTGSSTSNMHISFPSRYSKDEIEEYDAKDNPLEDFGLFYENLPTGNAVVNVDMSQGSGNKLLSYLKDMLKSKELGGGLELQINRLKESKTELAGDKKRHQQELDKKTADFQQKMQRQQAKISTAERATLTLKALREGANKSD